MVRLLSIALLAACANKEAPSSEAGSGDMAPEAPVAPAAPEAPEPVAAADAGDEAAALPVVGTWHTVACGEVEYAQELVISEDGSFTYTDLVSPCPPNARCMWSGVVVRSGTWTAQGPTVSLSADGGIEGQKDDGPVALPELPGTVGLAHDSLKASDGCLYRRGPADRGFPMKGERVRVPDSPK